MTPFLAKTETIVVNGFILSRPWASVRASPLNDAWISSSPVSFTIFLALSSSLPSSRTGNRRRAESHGHSIEIPPTMAPFAVLIEWPSPPATNEDCPSARLSEPPTTAEYGYIEVKFRERHPAIHAEDPVVLYDS
jgi:hypothetical protein